MIRASVLAGNHGNKYLIKSSSEAFLLTRRWKAQVVDRNQLCALLAMRTFLAFGLCLRRQTVRGTVLLPTVGSVAICVRMYVTVFCVSFTIILLYTYVHKLCDQYFCPSLCYIRTWNCNTLAQPTNIYQYSHIPCTRCSLTHATYVCWFYVDYA